MNERYARIVGRRVWHQLDDDRAFAGMVVTRCGLGLYTGRRNTHYVSGTFEQLSEYYSGGDCNHSFGIPTLGPACKSCVPYAQPTRRVPTYEGTQAT